MGNPKTMVIDTEFCDAQIHGNQHLVDEIQKVLSAKPNCLGQNTTGWWYTYPSEKYESQWKGLSILLWKIKNVPNHQPDKFGVLHHLFLVLMKVAEASKSLLHHPFCE